MIKIGNKVSLFDNIGREGVVIKLIPVQAGKRKYAVPVSNSWKLLIEWNDGTRSQERITDVMRIDQET